MLVRKFEADTMAAALKQVKEALGPEALVLSTRTLGKKGLGVLGRQTIEITAAIESPAMKTPARAAAKLSGRAAEAFVGRATGGNRIETLDDEIVTLSRRTPPAPTAAAHQLEDEVRRLRAQIETQNIDHLRSEIDQLKALIKQLAQTRMEPCAVPAAAPPAGMDSGTVRPVAVQHHSASSSDPILELLREHGIDSEAAATIARYAEPRMSPQQRLDSEMQREFLCTTLAGLVQTSGPLWSAGEPQKKVSLIGATGVGKTTTIAKLAARSMAASGARIALVTIDTYRIAAVEQLKIYAEIMGIPVDVVFSPEQLQETFRRHRDKDLILIDTAGHSPKDQPRIDELNTFLGSHSDVENFLVLAAPTADRLQQKSFEAFSKLPLAGLVFTKLDEADRCGSLINLPLRNNLPLGFLTNGQKVPEDLLDADPQLVAGLVMGLYDETRRIAV